LNDRIRHSAAIGLCAPHRLHERVARGAALKDHLLRARDDLSGLEQTSFGFFLDAWQPLRQESEQRHLSEYRGPLTYGSASTARAILPG
jgi:hypothetical protein